MNKKFISRLMHYIDHINDKINKFYFNYGDDFENYTIDQIIEITTLETEISTVKWLRDMYLDCE